MAAPSDDNMTEPCLGKKARNDADDTAAAADDDDETKMAAKKHSVQIVDPPVTEVYTNPNDRESGGYTIVKVEEKHGPLYWAIPTMPLPLAIICCIFNIVLPGFGTFMSSFTVFCCGSVRSGSRCRAFALNIVSAILQMLTFLLIVGWIWSILWGMTFVQFALATRDSGTRPPMYYVRRQSSL